jgi:transposase, IS5 family
LLNEARENAEALIDHLCRLTGSPVPRTYRQKARWDFLAFIKNKRPRRNKVRRAIKQQLQYIKRDIGYIELLLQKPIISDDPMGISIFACAAEVLKKQKKWQKRLDILRNVYAQQIELHETGTTLSKNRIVSFSQPHVRTIVRGKAKAPVEFGNKFSLMVVDGYCLPCELSWNAYNEGGCLKDLIEAYRQLFGCYPESVHADQIYCTQANRRFCFGHGIRISGKPLGRPKKENETNRQELREQAKQRRRDEVDRVEVEGKFGVAKRAGELGCIRTKLEKTSEATINLVFLIMNLRKIWRKVCFFLLRHRRVQFNFPDRLPSRIIQRLDRKLDELLERFPGAGALRQAS